MGGTTVETSDVTSLVVYHCRSVLTVKFFKSLCGPFSVVPECPTLEEF